MSLQTFCLCFGWLVFLVLSCKSSLYILEISSLSEVCFVNICAQSLACLSYICNRIFLSKSINFFSLPVLLVTTSTVEAVCSIEEVRMYILSDFKRKAFRLSLLSIMLVVFFIDVLYHSLRRFFKYCQFENFYHEWVLRFLSVAFLCLLRQSYGFVLNYINLGFLYFNTIDIWGQGVIFLSCVL